MNYRIVDSTPVKSGPQYVRDRADIQAIREYVTQHYRIYNSAETQLHNAVAIRDFVHINLAKGFEDVKTHFYERNNFAFLDMFKGAFIDKSCNFMCSGHVFFYMLFLALYQIPSRQIALYSKSNNTGYDDPRFFSHASCEVLIDGKWLAADPLLNMMYVDNEGAYLGYEELRRCVLNNQPFVSFSDHKMVVSPGLTAENLFNSFHDLFNYIVVDQAVAVDERGRIRTVPIRFHPSTWDGKITVKDVCVQDHAAEYKGKLCLNINRRVSMFYPYL